MEPKVAVITAGGGGMGAAITRKLHKQGYRVALMSRSEASQKLAKECDGLGLQGSVTEIADLERLVSMVLDTYGRIDAVVNHTAHPPKGELLEIPDDSWLSGFDILVMNVVRMARLVTPAMQKQGGGAWVNISTFAAFEPELALPVSCTLRAALSAFSKLYADRYAADNIRMNNLLPGFIDSLSHSAETVNRVPMGRIGTTREIADTTAFLLSDSAGYITGQSLVVDGGVTRHI